MFKSTDFLKILNQSASKIEGIKLKLHKRTRHNFSPTRDRLDESIAKVLGGSMLKTIWETPSEQIFFIFNWIN